MAQEWNINIQVLEQCPLAAKFKKSQVEPSNQYQVIEATQHTTDLIYVDLGGEY